MTDWQTLADELRAALHLEQPPVAITFGAVPGAPAFDAPFPPPLPDGRTGRVPAGCVFWMHATAGTFTTAPADHGNCSVGRLTHGLSTFDEVAANSDVAALLDSGWVTPEMIPGIPVVSARPDAISYGPLRDATADPDVILVRLNAKQLMVLSDAVPGLRVDGKPQCHIVAVAKETGEVAASVGCMLSRTRTGMASSELTCAIPAARLADVVASVVRTAAIDATVARYAAEDSRRFATS